MKRVVLYFLLPVELAAVTQRILNFIFAFVANEPCLKAAYDHVLKDLKVLNKALSKDKKSKYTVKLLQKDMERDNAFINFRDYVKAFRKSNDSTKKEAAKILVAIIRKYGFSLFKLPFIEQTNVQNRLIAELKEPKNLQYIQVLKATDVFEDLDSTAIAYENLRQEKVDVETAEEYAQIWKTFRDLGENLKDLLKFLALLDRAKYKPELPEIISNINNELTDVMAKARTRGTRKDKEDNKSAA